MRLKRKKKSTEAWVPHGRKSKAAQMRVERAPPDMETRDEQAESETKPAQAQKATNRAATKVER